MGMPSARTRARLAPLAPSPRNDTPCDVGLAVWLPDRRSSEKPGTWRSLSSVVKAPHCSNWLSVTAGIGLGFDVINASRGEVRVAVTSRLCCTAAGVSTTSSALSPACQATVVVENPGELTSMVPASPATPLKTDDPSACVTVPKFCPARWRTTCAREITAPLRSVTVPRTSWGDDAHAKAIAIIRHTSSVPMSRDHRTSRGLVVRRMRRNLLSECTRAPEVGIASRIGGASQSEIVLY